MRSQEAKAEARFTSLEARLSVMENRSVGPSGSTADSINPPSSAGGLPKKDSIPRGSRCTIIIGGFDYDSDREDVEKVLDLIARSGVVDVEQIEKTWAMGRYTSKGKITFTSPMGMWAFLKAMKGNKFTKEGKIVGAKDLDVSWTLWHGVEKTAEEQLCSRMVSKISRVTRGAFVEKMLGTETQAKAVFEPDYDAGLLRYKPPVSPGDKAAPIRLFKVEESRVVALPSASSCAVALDWSSLAAEANA